MDERSKTVRALETATRRVLVVRSRPVRITEAGVPVLASVAETLRPIRPDLPIPVTTTRPRQDRIISTARSNSPLIREIKASIARASNRRQ